MNTIKSIVAAVDGSESAMEAVRAAAKLADATGRKLILLYVHPDISHAVPDLALVGKERLKEFREQSARDIFESAGAVLGDRAEAPETILLWGDPAAEIIDYMQQNPGTHLVMGRRGLSRIKTLVLGSVSEKVLRHAPGLVTVVGD